MLTMLRYKKFTEAGPKAVHRFMLTQLVLNVVSFTLLIILILALTNMHKKMRLVLESSNVSLKSNIEVIKGSTEMSKRINHMKNQLEMVEAFQEEIIARTPHLYDQFNEMTNHVRKRLIEPLEEELKELKKKNKKGNPQVVLEHLGEYPI